MFKVFIDGKEGTTGLKIYDRLKNRQDIELLLLNDDERKDKTLRKEMMKKADIVFLCLPDEAAREAVAMMADCDAKIIDASTAHRTLNDWAYGLAELSDDFYKKIIESDKIAVPGCHASGFNALVYPLISKGILPKDYPLSCFSLTGYSGGGKSMIAQYQDKDREIDFDSPRQYAMAQGHKHLKEMQYISGIDSPPLFMPVVADYYCGMQVTIPLNMAHLKGVKGPQDIHQILYDQYEKDYSLIKVLPFGSEPDFLPANKLANLDNMEILVTGNEERVLLIATFDNLGKGASGAAVQCMNITLGLPAGLGLEI